jgi:penicillin-binding protein 1C
MRRSKAILGPRVPGSEPPAAITRWKTRLVRTAFWGGLGTTILAIAGWLAIDLVPLPPALFEPPPAPLELQDAGGQPLRQLRDGEGFVSRQVTLAEVPQHLIDATVAAEDKRFWSHPGVDWRATIRAALGYLRHRRVVSGASTITQQLLKLADYQPRNLRTKLVEAARALKLERVWSKERILSDYLNRIDYGNFNRGCAAAARFYFDKPLDALTLAEAALLAGLPQAPSRHNPHTNFDSARTRQQYVLDRMLANDWISPEEYDQALQEPIRLAAAARNFRAPHFIDFLIAREQEAPTLPASGIVRTTLDLELQTATERLLRKHLATLQEHRVREGAVVVLDNATGGVLALVGSPDYFEPTAGQVNGAWAPRSAGSTLKPFTYLLAYERGASPATIVADVPSTFPTPTGVFAPVNYDRRFHGPVRTRVALANSLNVAAVRVLASLGGAGVLQQRLQACGLTPLEQPADFYGLGLTIGNSEVRLLELVNAYATLARLGVHRPWRLTGEVPPIRPERLFPADCAWLIADVLDDDDARVASFGRGSPLHLPFPAACKTGTSSDFRDNWAIGYTPEFTVGVWVGNFDGSPMQEVSGVSGAGPVLHDVLQWLNERHGTTWYSPPGMILAGWVNPLTGKQVAFRAGPASGERPAASSAPPGNSPQHAPHPAFAPVREVFLATSPPPIETVADFDASGRLRLGPEYRDWLASNDNPFGDRVASDSDGMALQITWPVAGTVLVLDPDLPGAGNRLPLRASAAGSVEWQCPTLRIDVDPSGQWAELSPGRHRLQVVAPATGESASTWIEVRPL